MQGYKICIDHTKSPSTLINNKIEHIIAHIIATGSLHDR